MQVVGPLHLGHLCSTLDLSTEGVVLPAGSTNAVLKMLDADKRIDALVNAEKNKAAKTKGPKPKVKVGKKKAKVSWKKLSGKYKYQVCYSKKKSKGYELAATTTKN